MVVSCLREWLNGRASPSQGERCEFESRFPLHVEAKQTLLRFFCKKILRPLPCFLFLVKRHVRLTCSFVNDPTTVRCHYRLFTAVPSAQDIFLNIKSKIKTSISAKEIDVFVYFPSKKYVASISAVFNANPNGYSSKLFPTFRLLSSSEKPI